jgi:hypothetical protein
MSLRQNNEYLRSLWLAAGIVVVLVILVAVYGRFTSARAALDRVDWPAQPPLLRAAAMSVQAIELASWLLRRLSAPRRDRRLHPS